MPWSSSFNSIIMYFLNPDSVSRSIIGYRMAHTTRTEGVIKSVAASRGAEGAYAPGAPAEGGAETGCVIFCDTKYTKAL